MTEPLAYAFLSPQAQRDTLVKELEILAINKGLLLAVKRISDMLQVTSDKDLREAILVCCETITKETKV